METKIMNKIDLTFAGKKDGILSAYFTAGYPELDDTTRIMKILQDAGADMIEVGIPFSDPVADGPTIQMSNKRALDNGINLKKILQQVSSVSGLMDVPVILMGYLNPVYQYGFEKFCSDCRKAGVSGLILPDLPLREYLEYYRDIIESYGLYNIFLITPETSEKRIREIDAISRGFIYMVSSSSTTGAKKGITDEQVNYFRKIQRLKLKTPQMVGFGISDRQAFEMASRYAQGAIIGSAIIRVLQESHDLEKDLTEYIHSVKPGIVN